jgi:hypothetical protein
MHPLASADARPLLPNEPRVLDWPGEQALTERYLLPFLPQLDAFFLDLRMQVDIELSKVKPLKQGKPYPLGQCLEISLAVKQRLSQPASATLKGSAAQGHAALVAFLRHGGRMRQVWGDLRGDYFQNAFLAGTLYIDVSNDTVVPTKPKVEILPLVDARFTSVEDFSHYARTAARYWHCEVYPNHVLPALAPYCPLVTVTPDGTVRFQALSDYMLALAERDAFQSSVAVLDALAMELSVFRLMVSALAGPGLDPASDPATGRAQALQCCDVYRAEGRHRSSAHRNEVVKAVLEANRRLAGLKQ